MFNLKSASTVALLCVAGIAYAGYGDDRALIEDLQARYMFAFDYGDPDGYAGAFTPDGVLDYGGGEIKGRKAIAEFIATVRPPAREMPSLVPLQPRRLEPRTERALDRRRREALAVDAEGHPLPDVRGGVAKHAGGRTRV